VERCDGSHGRAGRADSSHVQFDGGCLRAAALRVYFENAAGVKDGAPVTLEGVTIAT